MKIEPLGSVDCSILHDQMELIGHDQMLAFLDKVGQQFGFEGGCRIIPSMGEGSFKVLLEDTRIEVHQSSRPCDRTALDAALEFPLTAMTIPMADDLISTHQAHTHISIGKGEVDLRGERDAEVVAALGGVCEFDTSQEANRAMRLCHAIIGYVIAQNQASLIHWHPSDHLVSQRTYYATANSDTNGIPLFVRPHLYSANGKIADGQPVGIVGVGSQWLVGTTIVFKEAPVPFQWMVERMTQLILYCQKQGRVIPHGEAFALDDNEVIRVEHGERNGHPTLELRVLRSREHGIRENMQQLAEDERDGSLVVHDLSGGDLDPQNEADRAILERLQQLQQSTQEQRTPAEPVRVPEPAVNEPEIQSPKSVERAAESENDLPAWPPEYRSERRSDDRKRGMDLSELRALVREEREKPKGRSWLRRRKSDNTPEVKPLVEPELVTAPVSEAVMEKPAQTEQLELRTEQAFEETWHSQVMEGGPVAELLEELEIRIGEIAVGSLEDLKPDGDEVETQKATEPKLPVDLMEQLHEPMEAEAENGVEAEIETHDQDPARQWMERVSQNFALAKSA